LSPIRWAKKVLVLKLSIESTAVIVADVIVLIGLEIERHRIFPSVTPVIEPAGTVAFPQLIMEKTPISSDQETSFVAEFNTIVPPP
jgi:hypothetical protein